MLREVQFIKGDEHHFLLGFYYRLCGRFSDALTKFEAIKDARYVGTRSRRELVQVYVQLEEYDKALELARANYEGKTDNQFHTQAYFNCLINSENPKEHSRELKKMIQKFRVINSSLSNEMADIGEALYTAKVDNDKVKALDLINDAVAKYPKSHYPLLALCDIALHFLNLKTLNEGIDQLERLSRNHNRNISNRTLNRYKAFSAALSGEKDRAVDLLRADLGRFPSESRGKIIKRINSLGL